MREHEPATGGDPQDRDSRSDRLARALESLAGYEAAAARMRSTAARHARVLDEAHQQLADYRTSAAKREDVRAMASELREAVREVVKQLRARDVPPERVLILVKGHLRDAEAREPNLRNAAALTDRIVSWSIEDYFAAD